MYEYNGTVERVVDGDTVILLVDLGFYVHSEVKVRLLDVFAPELKKRKADKDGSGEAAKAELERLLPVGADVLLVSKERRKNNLPFST